jgi:hypothetical protein
VVALAAAVILVGMLVELGHQGKERQAAHRLVMLRVLVAGELP